MRWPTGPTSSARPSVRTVERVAAQAPADAPLDGDASTSTADGRTRFDAPASFVFADVVVLAAGTLGSTEILLRSRAGGLAVSPRLGDRFTGNGDVLAFAYDVQGQPMRGIGAGRRPVTADTAVGPCITGHDRPHRHARRRARVS